MVLAHTFSFQNESLRKRRDCCRVYSCRAGEGPGGVRETWDDFREGEVASRSSLQPAEACRGPIGTKHGDAMPFGQHFPRLPTGNLRYIALSLLHCLFRSAGAHSERCFYVFADTTALECPSPRSPCRCHSGSLECLGLQQSVGRCCSVVYVDNLSELLCAILRGGRAALTWAAQ